MTRKLPEVPSECEGGIPKKIMMVRLSECWWRMVLLFEVCNGLEEYGAFEKW